MRGLRAFGADYPESRRLILYRGHERLAAEEIVCLPIAEFLLSVKPDAQLAH